MPRVGSVRRSKEFYEEVYYQDIAVSDRALRDVNGYLHDVAKIGGEVVERSIRPYSVGRDRYLEVLYVHRIPFSAESDKKEG